MEPSESGASAGDHCLSAFFSENLELELPRSLSLLLCGSCGCTEEDTGGRASEQLWPKWMGHLLSKQENLFFTVALCKRLIKFVLIL